MKLSRVVGEIAGESFVFEPPEYEAWDIHTDGEPTLLDCDGLLARPKPGNNNILLGYWAWTIAGRTAYSAFAFTSKSGQVERKQAMALAHWRLVHYVSHVLQSAHCAQDRIPLGAAFVKDGGMLPLPLEGLGE